MHLILDCELLEVEAGALREMLKSRLENTEAVTAEEQQKKTDFILRLVARVQAKARNLYAALHP